MGNNEVRGHWKNTDLCCRCTAQLTVLTRHHCRYCGLSFCANCCKYVTAVTQYYQSNQLKRVCYACYTELEKDRKNLEKYKNLSLKDFDLLTLIGTGKYGKVVKVRMKSSGKIYAMKILNKKSIIAGGEIEHTIAERNILMKVKHPFLMRLRYAFQTQEKLILLMDFINGGELFYHLQLQPDRKFSNDRAKFYAAEICLGIEHLHLMGIIYRDIKPENILLDLDGHIRLTDFGLSKEGLMGKDKTKTFCGTPEYLAPEVLAGGGYTIAVDWWGFGALIYEMLTGWTPFYEKDVQKMYQLKISRKIGVPDYVDDHAKDLLIKLLERNPERRLTDPNQIKKHPWFASIDWEKLYNKEIEPPYKPTVNNQESTEMIDDFFKTQSIREVIGRDDEKAIDDSKDSRFKNYSYVPQGDEPEPEPETGSWAGRTSPLEEITGLSKSQPNSYTAPVTEGPLAEETQVNL